MVTPGFYENTIHLTLSAMMNANANPVNKANEANEATAIALGSAEEHQLEQELVEAAAKGSLTGETLAATLMAFQEKLTRAPEAEAEEKEATESFASRVASGAVARAVVKAAARAVVDAAKEIAAAVELQEQQAAEREVARAAKKQRVDDKRGQCGTGELEQANSLIEELQSQLSEMKKKYQALAAMLNEMGVDNNKIAEHLSRST